jgi:hypothetical protein
VLVALLEPDGLPFGPFTSTMFLFVASLMLANEVSLLTDLAERSSC